jgi:hypothetical protein
VGAVPAAAAPGQEAAALRLWLEAASADVGGVQAGKGRCGNSCGAEGDGGRTGRHGDEGEYVKASSRSRCILSSIQHVAEASSRAHVPACHGHSLRPVRATSRYLLSAIQNALLPSKYFNHVICISI